MNTQAKKQIADKIVSLKKVIAAPANTVLQQQRKKNAELFLKELEELSVMVDFDFNVKIVPMSTLEKQVGKADFARLDFDGEFCKLALIQNCPYDDLWLLHMAPLKNV